MHIIWRDVSPKFIEVCTEDAFQCRLEVHEYGGCKVMFRSSSYIVYIFAIKSKIIALQLTH